MFLPRQKQKKLLFLPAKYWRVPFVYVWFVLFAYSFCIVVFLFASDSRNSSSFATVTRVQTRLQLTKYLCEPRRRTATCDKNNFAQIFVPALQFCLEANRNNSNWWEFVLVILVKRLQVVYANGKQQFGFLFFKLMHLKNAKLFACLYQWLMADNKR